jgi:hypothetical protein
MLTERRNTMVTRILRWPLGLAVTALLTLGLVTLPASATTLPVIQAFNTTGWSGMVTQPIHIYIGQGGSPYAHKLTWSRWTTASGKATGTLDLWWCVPTCCCTPNAHPVTVWADALRTHKGMPYFSHLIYHYVNAKGIAKQLAYSFGYAPGATIPGWQSG